MKLLRFAAMNLFSLGRVELDLANRGVLLITGYSEDEGSANGAGKSSLASKGPVWVLWGLTPGGIKTDKVINRHGKKKCWGLVYFTGVDGETYCVRRERPAKLSLFKDGEKGQDLSKKKASETQALIDQLLGRDFKTFVQTDFFGQGRSMSYAGLTPREQKALLEQILPMKEIDEWAEYASKCESALLKMQVTQETQVGQLDYKHKTQLDHLATLKVKQGQWYETAKLNIEALEKNIEAEQVNTEAARARIVELDAAIAALGTSCQTQDETIAKQMLEVKKEVDANLKQYTQASKSVSAWQNRLAGYEASDLDGVNVANKICPLCLSNISDDTHDSLVLRQRKLEGLKDEAKLNINQAIAAEEHFHGAYCDSQDRMGPLRTMVQEHTAQIQHGAQLVRDRAKLDKSIGNTTDQLKLELKHRQEAINPWGEEIDQVVVTCGELAAEAQAAQVKLAALDEEVHHVSFWREFFSKELKLQLFESTCPFLAERTKHHLDGLRNPQIYAEFNTIKRLADGTPKDEFTVRVFSETGGDGFDSLSGGEQQIVSFAIGLALADLATAQAEGSSSFLILDEPFSQLDSRNSEAIVEYLTSDIGKTKETILLISNEDELKTLIPNRVHVIKRRGVSQIER